jgi:hypothetical protein
VKNLTHFEETETKNQEQKKERRRRENLRMQRGGGDFYSKIDLTVGNNGFGFELVKMCCNFCNVI